MAKKKISIAEAIKNAEGIVAGERKRGGGKQIRSVSIVNCNNGKRVTLSAKLFAELGSPETVQVAVDGKKLYIGEFLDKADDFKVSNKTRGYIYNASLVETLTEKMNIDFSNRTSVSFSDIKVTNLEGYPCAVIKYSSQDDE